MVEQQKENIHKLKQRGARVEDAPADVYMKSMEPEITEAADVYMNSIEQEITNKSLSPERRVVAKAEGGKIK